MNNPFTYNYKNSYHEYFLWFGINYKFTIICIEINTWYCVYKFIIMDICLFKRINYKKYKENLERFKAEHNL